MHETKRDDVVYRFRVVSEDELGEALKGDALNDAPGSPATRTRDWLRSDRDVVVSGVPTTVRIAQRALVDRGRILGVTSLVSQNGHLDASSLERVASLVDTAAPRLAELAAVGAYRAKP